MHSNSSVGIDFKSFSPNLLIDYILETHHEYIQEKTPVLLMYLDKLCKVHGDRHPELFEINNLFKISATELLNHLQKEEVILFPFIKTMALAIKNNQTIQQPDFRTVDNPIAMLKHDHEMEGDLFAKHIHLENNILFHKAKELEERFSIL